MQTICGVNVSKLWLDGWIAPDHAERFANTPEEIEELAGFCRTHGADLVVMEATGGLSGISCVGGRLNITPPWL